MGRKGRTALSLLATSLVLPGALGAAGLSTLSPVDEATSRPDFLAFRTKLLEIVTARDATALLRVVHPDIKNTFGGDNGIAAFTERWRPQDCDSELWRTLQVILALGGSFAGTDVFIAPYVSACWPEELDPIEYVALVGADVPIRLAPTTQARILETLSYTILRLEGDGDYPQQPWTAVVLPDGRSGYVAADSIRSPLDYRAYFAYSDGQWRMTILIAGD